MIRGSTFLVHPQIIKIVNNSETVGRRKIHENKCCLSRRFTAYLLTSFCFGHRFQRYLRSWWSECTSLVHPQIIKIVNNSDKVGRRKKVWNQKLLILTYYVWLTHLCLQRCTVSELSTILMIRRCTSLVHPQFIKIVNKSETVSRRKKLWKQKLLISLFNVWFTHFFATIKGFWVVDDLDDQRTYILSTSSDYQDR